MGKYIYTNILLILLVSTSMVACDKSTFKIREGNDSKVTSTDQTGIQPDVVEPEECLEDCEPYVEPPVVYPPTEPPVEPPVVYPPTEPPVEPPVVYPPTEPPVVEPPVVEQPTNDPYSCQYGKEIFGSVAYIIQGQNSLELLWNYFEARGPADPKVAYYQVVVMDSRMNEEGTFKSQYLSNNGYLVHPGSIDINGKRLDSKIEFKYGNWYWYKLIALDKDYNVVNNHEGQPHIRKLDIGMDGNYKQFYRVVGYCDGNY